MIQYIFMGWIVMLDQKVEANSLQLDYFFVSYINTSIYPRCPWKIVLRYSASVAAVFNQQLGHLTL